VAFSDAAPLDVAMVTSPKKPNSLQMGAPVPDDTRRSESVDEPEPIAGRTVEPAPSRQHASARPASDKESSGFDTTFIQVMSLLLVLLLLVKAYGVARFSLTTSVALVTAAPLSVLIGTLELYAYAFMAALAAVALWLFIMGMLANGELRRWTPLTFALFLFATLLAPPLYLYWTFGAVAISLILYQIFIKSPRAGNLYRRLTRSGGMPSPSRIAACIAALLAAGFLLVTIDRPWLPAEVVALKHPIIVRTTGARQHSEKTSRPVVFIVSEQNDETTMLVDEDRYLVSISTNDIEVRVTCRLEGQFGSRAPLLWVILGRSYSSPNLACWRLTDQPEECPPPSPSRGPCPGPPPAVIKPS
jgi:hypothetical protein